MKTQILLIIGLFVTKLWSCTAKPISGTDLRTGSAFSSESLPKNKGMVVVFMSAKCPCSQSHEVSIEKLASEFKEFSFVGVHSNSDEAKDLAALHFKEASFSFPIIEDSNAQIANEFGALKTPHAFIVGPKGECWYNGGVDETRDASKAKKFYLKQALIDLKSGREPQEKTTRTLGCTIKR